MPEIIKQVPSGNAGKVASGVGRDFLNTTYGVGLLMAAYLSVKAIERKAREMAAKNAPAASQGTTSEPFAGLL